VVNSALIGALIAMLAAVRLARLREGAGMNALSLLLGFRTVVSPRASGYVTHKGALANSLMVDVLATALALCRARATATEPKNRPGVPGH
jgi:hypothetical protein